MHRTRVSSNRNGARLGRAWRLVTVGVVFALAVALIGQASAPVAQAQTPDANLQKLDPYLRILVETPSVELVDRNSTLFAPDSRFDSAGEGAALETLRSLIPLQLDQPSPTVDIFARTTASDGTLASLGLEVFARTNDVIAGRIPVDALSAFSKRSDVSSVEAAQLAHPTNDLAVIETGASLLRDPLPGYDGTGVVVGVVDSGIDIRHQDFQDADGKTRIKWLFDPTVPGPYRGGTLYTEADINAELGGLPSVPHIDVVGHGTHVAGSAAGDGSSDDTIGRFAGIAPRADLLIATPLAPGGGSTAQIVASVAFVNEFAATLGQPWVANLSLGSHHGPHDGTSLYEEMLDEFIGAGIPGKSIVVAAGNEGNDDIHASGTVVESPPGAPSTVDLTFSVSPGTTAASFEIWYEGEDDFRFGWAAPNGVTARAADDHYVSGDSGTLCTTLVTSINCVSVVHGIPTPDPDNGDHQILVTVFGEGIGGSPAPLLTGTWTFELEADVVANGGRFDAWSKNQSGGVPFTSLLDDSMRIGRPATAVDVISVGAYGTSTEFGQSVGPATSFSSPGPTRDGRAKPEIIAPGSMVISALSGDSTPVGPVFSGGLYAGDQGTSMASPMVAGAIALLLQADPTLDSEEIRDLLIATAREDEFTGGDGSGWDAKTGWGKLNVFAAFAELLDTDVADSTVTAADAQVPADGVSTTTITVTLVDDLANPVVGHGVIVGESPTGDAVFEPALALSNAAGIATFEVSSSVPGPVSVRAFDATDGVLLLDAAPITFTVVDGDANLSALTISDGTLAPTFDPGTTDYTANVANTVESIEITATTSDPSATLAIEGSSATSGVATSVALVVGPNEIDVLVTAPNGTTERLYTVTVTRAAAGPSDDATLSNLEVSEGTLSPSFDSGVNAYSVDVPNAIDSIDVTATTNDDGATLEVNGSPAASGVGENVLLSVGPNVIEVDVTAEDGTPLRYTVTVTRADPPPPVPLLARSPAALDFGTSGTSDSFNIDNDGEGTLSWSLSDNRPWISVAPTSGTTTTETDSVTVTVNRDGLDPGDYNGTVTITSNGGDATVTVSMTVPEPLVPLLARSPAALDFGTSETSDTFNIDNDGEGTLSWSISDDQPWLSVAPTSGSTTTETDSVTVTVNRDGLDPGDYDGTVTITSNGGNATVAISMTVPEPPPLDPVLARSPATLDFGTAETSDSFNIDNDGEGTLSWSVSDNQPWISVAPTSGSTTTETDSVTVTVNRDGLDPGDYNGTVTITSNGGDATVAISMSVPEPPPLDPVLARSPAALDFGTIGTSDSFDIDNDGEGTLSWSVSDNQPWISVAPTSGTTTTETDSVTVTVNRDGLDPGGYNGTVTITSNGGDSTVAVSMSVPEPPPPAPNDATLKELSLSSGSLNPGFTPLVTEYTANVSNGVTSVTVTATATNPLASVVIDPASPVALAVGANEIEVEVTSEDTTVVETYTITVTRAAAPPPPPPPSFLTITPTLSVVNDDGGSASVDDFTVLLNGSAIDLGVASTGTSGLNQLTVDGPVSLYALTFSGDCDSSGAFTLPSASALDCDIKADDLPLTTVLSAPLPGAATLIDESLSFALDSFLVDGVRSVQASTAEENPLLTVTVPLSAVPGQSSVTVSVVEGNADAARFNPAAGTVFIAGMAYDIQILDANGDPIEDFATPIELSFLLPEGVDASAVAAYFWDEEASAWRVESGTVVDGRFVVSTSHLTVFALFEFAEGGGVFDALPPSGIALRAAEGGTVAQLEDAVRSRGATAVFVSHEGRLVGYVFDAPSFVNAEFLAVTGGVLSPGRAVLVILS